MSQDVTINAAVGAIRWGFYQGGSLRDCAVRRTSDVWTLAGSIVSTNAARLSQRPLVFVVTHQHGCWTWPITELQIAGGTLSARLGPPEG